MKQRMQSAFNHTMTPQLAQAELKAIEQRAEKATKGPWYTAGLWTVLSEKDSGQMVATMCRLDYEENSNFIAHARTDIPRLLSHIRELEKQLLAFMKVPVSHPKTHIMLNDAQLAVIRAAQPPKETPDNEK